MASHSPAHGTLAIVTPHGRLRWCPACSSFELRFGNALLGLAPEDVAQLLVTLAERATSSVPDGATADDHTLLWLDERGAGLRFSREETVQLQALLLRAGELTAASRPVRRGAVTRSAFVAELLS